MENNNWGVGWDYLLEDIWFDLDKIRIDNLNSQHNDTVIDKCFNYIYKLFYKDILQYIKKTDWEMSEKIELTEKANKIREYFKQAKTINDKVIAINMAEQFLRAIY